MRSPITSSVAPLLVTGGLRFNILDGEPTPQIVRESVNNERAFAKSVAYHDQLLQKQLNEARNGAPGDQGVASAATNNEDPPPPYTPSESGSADPAAGVAALLLAPAATATAPPPPVPMKPGMPSWGTPSASANAGNAGDGHDDSQVEGSAAARDKNFFEHRAQESAKAREAELAKLSPEARARVLAEEAEVRATLLCCTLKGFRRVMPVS